MGDLSNYFDGMHLAPVVEIGLQPPRHTSLENGGGLNNTFWALVNAATQSLVST
jgi:hypothetical protein